MRSLPHRITFSRVGIAITLLALIVLSLISPWHSATAQTATDVATPLATSTTKVLSYDNPVAGLITDAVIQETWTFNAPFRDRIAISVDRANNTLVPNVALLDPDGKTIAHADHDATAAHTGINDIKLERAGTYTIVVGRDKGQDGKTNGNYILKVSLLGTGPENPALYAGSNEPIRPIRPARGEITNAKWLDIQDWVPISKDHVLLTATRADGTLMPTITLVGPDNQTIGHAEPDATGAKAVLEATIPTPGQYEIRVGRTGDQSGATTGKYVVTETVLGLGADNTGLLVIEGNVDFDTPRKGTLVGRSWQNTWAFTADSAMSVTITMNRDSGTLIPALQLLDANRKELASAPADDTWATATISNFQLPAAGQYLVVVNRADGAAGLTMGDYDFTVTQANK